LKSLPKRRDAGQRLHIVFLASPDEEADPPHAIGLLRARLKRPDRRTSNKRNELPPPHCRPQSSGQSIVTVQTRLVKARPGCLLWVKSGSKNPSLRCPLYPQ